MPLLGSATKQPREIEKYAIDYSKDLESTDHFVVEEVSVIALDEATEGLPVIDSYVADIEGQKLIMFISGGTAGSIYKITAVIMADSGRRLEDEFKLKIKDY